MDKLALGPDGNGPDSELFHIFHSISKLKLSALFDNLTHMEFVTLSTLDVCGIKDGKNKVKISEIASKTNVRSSAVSRTVNSLESKGYIRRTSDSIDRRNTYVELTDEGHMVAQQCKSTIDDFLSVVFEKVGKDNMKQVLEILNKIYEVSREELEIRSNGKKINKE